MHSSRVLQVSGTLFAAGLLLAGGPAAAAESSGGGDYVAHLTPMNSSVTGSQAAGEAQFSIKDDELTITIDVSGVPAGIVHWQHFHGTDNGTAASCPTEAADANHDGVIDLMETAPSAGMTMVPFDDDPAAMDVAHGTYPTASADGSYHYQQTVSLKALEAGFAKAFPGQQLDLGKRVVFIHGIPADHKLPSSVASLGPIPAQVTLPIACGKIEPVEQ